MPETAPGGDGFDVLRALALAGRDDRLRSVLFETLRRAEQDADDPTNFRANVRWPIVRSVLAEIKCHRVTLAYGLMCEVEPDSRIEQALLLSSQARPDHVWEPQTTKLLMALARETDCILVGGAYIGDHVLYIAQVLAARGSNGVIHAFEPMSRAFKRLVRNLDLNALDNVVACQAALWDRSDRVQMSGPAALACAAATVDGANGAGESVPALRIDDYVRTEGLASVGFIMLDTEGGEERALRGAQELLSRSPTDGPHLVFEVHRHYVDWSCGLDQTPIAQFLSGNGYTAYAIRDFHDNYSMADRPIEIIPLDRVYLEGPPHGFNVLATKDADLVGRLSLRVVKDVSPKLLVNRNPALHHPLDGLPLPHSWKECA